MKCKALVRLACLVLGFAFAGVGGAQAATYYFTYTGSGDGVSIANGILDFDGTSVTSVSGTLTWPSNPDGSGSLAELIYNPASYYNSGADYDFQFSSAVGPDQHDVYIDLNEGFSTIRDNTSNVDSIGTSTAAPAPAPIPGGGLLSFAVLGLGAAFRVRRSMVAALGRSFRSTPLRGALS